MKYLHLTLVSLGSLLLVAGCGGGGGGTPPGGKIPTGAVKITSSNATAVAKSSNSAAQSTTSGSGLGSTFVTGIVTQPTHRLPSVLKIATAAFDLGINTPPPAATVVGAVQTESRTCVAGNAITTPGAQNSYTMSASIAGSTFAKGDSFTLSFVNCSFVAGATFNGSMGFAVTDLTGPLGGATSAAFKLTFGSFTMADATTSETVSMDGDISISSREGATATCLAATCTTSSIYGTSFTMTDTVGGTTDSLQLTAYNETYAEDTSGEYSYSIDMTLAGTAMGGSVKIATTTAFIGNTGNNDGNPTAGSMTIDGASSSSLTITVNPTGITYEGTDGTTPFGPTDVAWANL